MASDFFLKTPNALNNIKTSLIIGMYYDQTKTTSKYNFIFFFFIYKTRIRIHPVLKKLLQYKKMMFA